VILKSIFSRAERVSANGTSLSGFGTDLALVLNSNSFMLTLAQRRYIGFWWLSNIFSISWGWPLGFDHLHKVQS